MSPIKKIVFLVLISWFTIQNGFSQEIQEDTIYTSLDAPTFLFFHDKVTFCDYIDPAAYSSFVKKQYPDNSISIKSKVKNAPVAKIKITEGPRSHFFILMYKEQLSSTEHDWSDLNKLRNYVGSLERKRALNAGIKTAPQSKVTSQLADQPVVKKEETSLNPSAAVKPIEPDTYSALVDKGLRELNNRNYENARTFFNKAIEKNPADKVAREGLQDIENTLFTLKKDKDNRLKDEEFDSLKKTADNNFLAGNFLLAEQSYLRAISIRPGDGYLKTRLVETKQKILEINKEKQIKERDDKYKENLARADEALKEGKLEEARATFDIARNIKPLEKYPQEKIKEIDEIKRKQDFAAEQSAKQLQFDDEKRLGYEAYNAGNREVARLHFERALKIRKDTVAEALIKKIDLFKKDSIQIVRTEELARLQEKANTEKYNSLKGKGDRAFNENNYELAKKYYDQALDYKQEAYAVERLAETKRRIDEISAANERKKQFNFLVIKAKAVLNNNDYNSAAIYYTDALKLNEGDEVVMAKLAAINKKLEEIRLEKERNDGYDSAIARAAQAYADQAYNTALRYYKEASSFKPDDPYPTKQIMSINIILLDLEERKKQEDKFRQRKQVAVLKQDANNAIVSNNWQEALQKFQEILGLDAAAADKEFASQKIIAIRRQISKVDSITALTPSVAATPAKKKTKEDIKREAILKDARIRQEKIRQDTIAAQTMRVENYKKQMAASGAINSVTRSDNTSIVNQYWQSEAVPYERSELVKKYPGIDFEEIPAGQTYDPTGRKDRAVNFETSKRILLDTSSLNIYDSINYIKAICKSISFNGDNAFVKILIRNNSLADFLTGPIQLKLVKKNNKVVELHQRFISDFPIVQSQKEFPIVYVSDASVSVEPSDALIMEISDRSNKTKLKINIPGAIYNVRKTAKL